MWPRTVCFVLALMVFVVPASSDDWEKATQAYRVRDYASAERGFAEVARKRPGYAGAYYMLGLAQNGLGKTDEALASLRKAIELDSKQLSYRVALGQTQLQAKQYDDAYATLKQLDINAMAAQHRSSYALLFAQAATRTDRPEEAIVVLRSQIQADPRNPRLHQALGWVYDVSGDAAKAFESFRQAFDLDPKDSATGRSAAYAAISVARSAEVEEDGARYYSDAARLAERLSSSEPTFENYLLAGEGWLGAKAYEKALPWFEKAQTRMPKNGLVCYYKARCLYDLGNSEAALAAIYSATDLGVTGKLAAQVDDLRAEILQKTGLKPPGTDVPPCPGFRDSKWGDSRAQVQEVEGTPALTTDDGIEYSGRVGGHAVGIAFKFVDDKLVRGVYILAEDYTFKNQYIDVFNEFKGLLSKKYSAPVRDLQSPTERGHGFERMRTAIRGNADSVSSERGHFGDFVVTLSAIVVTVSTIVGTVSTIVGIAV
jgi:tetratricopeptide (TPR) repeat protein